MSYLSVRTKNQIKLIVGLVTLCSLFSFQPPVWQSRFVQESNGKLSYKADEKGNIIPDFSRVGYHQGNDELPNVDVVLTISAAPTGESQTIIQKAIDQIAKLPIKKQGIRGAILLKKGAYKIPGTLTISQSGIILRGEGNKDDGTVLIASGRGKRTLLQITGEGKRKEDRSIKSSISDSYVPVGTFSFNVENSQKFKVGDDIVIFRPSTANWISDIKMDQIDEREGTKQWKENSMNLYFERKITKIEGKKISIDNPIVMAMEEKYGGGTVSKYSFEGRISEVGVENIMFKSDYQSDTDEDHGWTAIDFEIAENCWVRNVTSQYFAGNCVNIGGTAKYITVTDSKYLDGKSIITGGRRYPFCIEGQLNLVKNCESTEARHDYATGSRVAGPNVFYNCKARNTHADIGPHHRWATGTLYDNIDTDGQLNVQDRGKMGSGQGWAGVNQVVWNCKAKKIVVQNPWVSAKNFCIGSMGEKYDGVIKDRPDGEWEGLNKPGLQPNSLYEAQLKEKKK